ncbi:MAG TPA: Stf0 family sulfotransferase [Solirubrobacteraceae bacterium]
MLTRSYLVCATQRSGSTLLCELLKDTGVAGNPAEYFEARHDTGRPPHPGDYLERLPRTGAGIRDDPTPPQAPPYSSLEGISTYRDHLERTFRLGTTDNGVFGAKLMWSQIPELQALAGQLPEYSGLTDRGLLEALFHDPLYVWVTRGDKVRQAVSLWRALQTRSWRLENGPDASGEAVLQYRFEGIRHLVRQLEAEDAAWGAFFGRHGIDRLAIAYEEDLMSDRDRAVRSVLERLGVKPPAGWRAAEPLKRQADAVSDDWVAAYHRDAARRGQQPDTRTVPSP